MPSNPSDLPPTIGENPEVKFDLPPIGRNPESGSAPWQNLQSLFDKKMSLLREMRDAYGIEKADAAQAIILKEFPRSEYKMWEDMFDQSRLQGISATNVIVETRKSFNTLMEPILTKEQEDEEERMDELRQMLDCVLKKIYELENCGSKITVSKQLSIGLMKQVESYFDLVQSSEEAKSLIQEIVVSIGRLAELINESQSR